MGLEEDIKQKEFKSEYIKLALNIMYTGNWLHLVQTRKLKKWGLSHQQYNVLRILRGQHPKAASVGTVLSRMLEPSSNITRLVDKLEVKKMVSRCENKDNRRMQDLKITKDGLKLLEEIGSELDDLSKLFEYLDIDEVKTANKVLDSLRDKQAGTTD
jgi:DNA-binding MarR family transcriptional regulator